MPLFAQCQAASAEGSSAPRRQIDLVHGSKSLQLLCVTLDDECRGKPNAAGQIKLDRDRTINLKTLLGVTLGKEASDFLR